MRLRTLLIAAAALNLAAGIAAARPDAGLVFEPNRGQTHADVRWLARGEGYTLFLAEREAVFALEGRALRMRLVGARAPAAVEGESPLPGRSHYFDLSDGRPLAHSVEHVARVRYRSPYEGTDLVYYGNDGRLEYDFELAPGADPSAIALAFEGAERMAIAEDGGLELALAGETLRFEPPVSYQPGRDGREAVDSRYVLDGDVVRFALGAYDPARPLVIDPVFVYATYLGGSDDDRAYDIVVNAAGEAYVTGETASALDFPLASALDASHGGALDAYVTKFAADGRTVLFSTFLGGPLSQSGHGIALDPAGNIYVVGTNDQNLFELKLNPTASAIVYSHTVGGSSWDAASEVVADAAGNAYIAASSLSSDFPTVNALTPNHGGNSKGVFRKIGPTGTVLVSTFLGVGTPSSAAIGVALDPGGNVLLTGYTEVNDPDRDLFVLKLTPAGTSVVYSKIFGGTLGDTGVAIATDAGSRAYVAGWTDSPDFPIANAADATFAGGEGFVMRLDHLGNLLASTYLGGADFDEVSALAIEPSGAVLAAGSSDVAFFARRATTWRLSASLGTLHAKAYYGTCHFTLARGVATNADGVAFVAATTPSGCSMPTTSGAFRTSRPNRDNAHVAKIDMATLPTVSINDRSRLEGNSNGLHDFYVTVSGNAAAPVFVDYATANGTATAGSDYAAFSGRLEVAPGSGGAYLQVPIFGDVIAEPDETFTLDLSAPVDATIVDGQGLGTIRNDDAPNGTLQLGACSANESSGAATVTVTRANGSNGPVGVAYATANGTAVAGSDYVATSGTLDWPSGDTDPRTFVVPLTDDAIREGNETFSVALSAPTGGAALGAPSSVACTVDDDEPVRSLSIADVTVVEGTGAVLTLRASGASAQPMRASIATANGTAAAGADYTAASFVLEIPAGATSVASAPIATIDDTIEEGAETFVVNLGTPVNATIADAQAQITITDNDEGGTIALASAVLSISESGGNAVFTVTRSGGAASGVTVAYATSNGSATAGSDYTARSGTLSFAAAQSQQTVSVPITSDTVDEPNETFTLTLSSPTGGATLGSPAAATATILDDDEPAPPGTLRFTSASYNAAESGSATLVVERVGGSAGTVGVSYSSATGSAGAADFTASSGTLSFGPGILQRTIAVPIAIDALDEPDETFTVALSSPTGTTLATPSTTTVTILDDDAPPTVSIDDCTGLEGTGGTPGKDTCEPAVRLSQASGRRITVGFSTFDGTAKSASDYLARTGTLAFEPGDTVLYTDVVLVPDAVHEGNETFEMRLSVPVNAALGDAIATATILDDDGDAGTLAFNLAFPTTLSEAAGTGSIVVTRTGGTAGAVSVPYIVDGIDATPGVDFVAADGVVSWNDGEGGNRTVTFTLIDDVLLEGRERFTVELGVPTGGAAIGTPSLVTYTIEDDEDAIFASGFEGGGGRVADYD